MVVSAHSWLLLTELLFTTATLYSSPCFSSLPPSCTVISNAYGPPADPLTKRMPLTSWPGLPGQNPSPAVAFRPVEISRQPGRLTRAHRGVLHQKHHARYRGGSFLRNFSADPAPLLTPERYLPVYGGHRPPAGLSGTVTFVWAFVGISSLTVY